MKGIASIYRTRLTSAPALALLFCLSFSTCLFTTLHFLFSGNAKNAAVSILLLCMILLLPLCERLLRIRIPTLGYALLFFLILGSLLGSCFDFYFLIPHWDTILHALSGFLFASIGYGICKLLFAENENVGNFPYLLFGILFSLSAALLWELFEAGATALLPVDMQEDTLLYSIKSFFLSGTHSHPLVLDGITETVIRYKNGQTLRIAGYLDLGLSDTLSDMAVCFLGNLAFLLLFPLDKCFRGRLLPFVLPSAVKKSAKAP